MSTTLAGGLRDELLLLFEPLTTATSLQGFQAMLASFGRTGAVAGNAGLIGAIEQAASLIGTLQQIDEASLTTWDGIGKVLQASEGLFSAIQNLENAVTDPSLAGQVEGLGEAIAARLVALYLRRRAPGIYRTASLLTLVDPAETATPAALEVVNGQVVRTPFVDDTFHFDRLQQLINDPWPTLRDAYFPNGLAKTEDAYAGAALILPLLSLLASAAGLPSARDLFSLQPPPDSNDDITYGDHFSDAPPDGEPAAPPDDLAAARLQQMPRLVVRLPGLDGAERLGLLMTVSSHEHPGGVAGVIFSLESAASWSETRGPWKLEFAADGQVPAFVLGPAGVSLAPVNGPLTSATGSFSVGTVATGSPAFVFGSATGTRIEVGGAQLGVKFALSPVLQSIGLTAGVDQSALVIAPGDGDGFLSSVLPYQGLRATFELGISASSDGGFSIRGGAGLDATLPVGLSLGPVSVPTIHLAITAGVSGVSLETSASVSLSIGPVQAVVDGIGLLTTLTFRDGGGNLGPADVSLGFKAPSGVGLSVDAAGVTGGGFLKFDPGQGQYSGVLQLQFTDLALQAFGLITTQVAGGHGYSLLALIDAEFPPVQLGWGFTLNGVGGILAVHRAASVDALRAALKAGQLGSVLFPKNAISNAPLVLAELDKYFPTAAGRFLFGPMALIGWGTPTILTAAIAVIVELPEPIRIILLARISARMPSESGAVVRINMDALGVLDLGKDELSLDATLFDSKILDYTLSGDMALRAAWGAQREFLLAIGGFHPQFTPPPGFPALKRLTIDMPSGSISKMRLVAYLAITSNTVQFGASLDVFIGVSGYGVAGHLSFDALFQWSPFHFTADISGRVALMAGGDDLMSVELKATLTGPGRWNVAGHFKIDLFLFDVSIDFSYSWGHDPDTQTIAAVDVLGLLTAALADARNWGTQLPAGVPKLVSLSDTVSGEALAHPLSRLEVHESVVPLGIQITRIGAAVPSGATTFTITGFSVNASAVSHEDIEDDFAPAQFFDLTDEEKLARPSFESHNAGVRMGAGLVKSGAAVTKTMGYETFYIDTPGATPRPEAAPPSPVLVLEIEAVLAIGSAGSAPVWKSGNRRYSAPGNPIRIAPQKFAIADASTLAPAGVGAAGGATYTEMKAALTATLTQDRTRRGSLEIVSTHELV